MRWQALAIGCLSWLMLGAATPQIWTGTFIPDPADGQLFAGARIPDSKSSTSAITRVIDQQYFMLSSFGGLHHEAALTAPCFDAPPTLIPDKKDGGCPAIEASAGAHGADMAVTVDATEYFETPSAFISDFFGTSAFEAWGCRDTASDNAACSDGATCLPTEVHDGRIWNTSRFRLPLVFHNVTTGRYFQNSLIGALAGNFGCASAATGYVSYLAYNMTIVGTDTVTISSGMRDEVHYATMFNAYAAQRVSEMPKLMTQFPANGGLMAHGNMETFTVGTDQGKWKRNTTNGTLAAVPRNFADRHLNYSVHGNHGAYTGRTDATNDWLVQGDFVDTANRSGATKYYYLHEALSCQDRNTEIRVSDLAAADYTFIEADSVPVVANSYRVFYQDDASTAGWTSAPKHVPTGYPRVPQCNALDTDATPNGFMRLVAITIAVPADAATQSFKVWTRVADPADDSLSTRPIYWDEAYMGEKEDLSLDLVDAFPDPLDIGLYGDSNFPEALPASPTCTAALRDSIGCGHLVYQLDQIYSSIGGTVPLSNVGLGGKTLCGDMDLHPNDLAIVLASWSYVGSSLDYLIHSRKPEAIMIARYANDGNPATDGGNKKVSEAADCMDRAIDKVRGANIDPLVVMPAIFRADDPVDTYVAEDGTISVTLGEWLDDMAIRIIADGIVYNAD